MTGTYVNAIGDLMQSILGFAGTTQWAAGLHVVWLTLAMGLTGRVGAGTVTGLLKGLVELLTGNTHGLLVVLIDLIAGLLVDAVFLFSAERIVSRPICWLVDWQRPPMCLRSSSLRRCPPICWRTVRWRWWDSWPSRRVWSSLVC